MKKRYMLGGIGVIYTIIEKIIKSNRRYEEVRPIYNVNERLANNLKLIEQKADERCNLVQIVDNVWRRI